MNPLKRILFYIGNVIIGVIGFYAYLYFWVTFSWGETFQVFSLETLISIVLGAILFIGFNYLLLRNENEKRHYWTFGLGIVMVTLIIIVTIIESS